MANAFTNFLSSVGEGVFGDGPRLKDYQHGDRLFVRNFYARAPKFGFLFYVTFEINENAIKDTRYRNRKGPIDVGYLVKKTELPSFEIQTETNNQYNRKTITQHRVNYTTINLEFYDDNADITNNLWKNYYKYYYADSNYGDTISSNGSRNSNRTLIKEYEDTKYGENDYAYGYNNTPKERFFNAINIYVLHRGKGLTDFSQFILINPTILGWNHDSVDYSDGNKTLTNKMRIGYENVIYKEGKINKRTEEPKGFAIQYYDTSPSPLSVAGGGTKTLLGSGGVLAGVGDVFGAIEDGNFLGAAILANNTRKNLKQLSKAGLKTEGLSVLNGVLGNVQATGNQPGGIGAAVQTGVAQSGLGVLGNVGVQLFSDKNSSSSGITKGQPKNTTGG